MPLANQVSSPQVADPVATRALRELGAAVNAILKFLERYRNPPKWASLGLHTGWSNYGASVYSQRYFDAAYAKMPDGTVRFRGVVKQGGADTTIFQLPVDARPVNPLILATAGDNAFARLDVTSDGKVILAFGTAASYLSLDGLSFDTRS